MPSPLTRLSRGKGGVVRLDGELRSPPEVTAAARVPSVVYSPARSMVLPLLRGHSRSSTVSSASAEHGASTGTWVGVSLRGKLRGVYSPVLTRGLHSRTEG